MAEAGSSSKHGDQRPACCCEDWRRRLRQAMDRIGVTGRKSILRQRFVTWAGRDRPAANNMRMAAMPQHRVRQVSR